ncbi:phage major capsid protein [Paenilisteria newyorkensis]|uniref:phage major capsid protein n=1 Tax=Listeria newyorkensis TaxID=1497681 RepID=UPI00235A03C1|nr:phage major capsid protein [Listeria newyorkensis]WAO22037.1 phage major capsid protein [Listeria newyorkensis]
MTMKLKGDAMENFNAAKQTFINAMNNNEDQDKQSEAYMSMIDSLAENVKTEAVEAARKEAEQYAIGTTADGKLSANRRKFYNEMNKEVGYKEETLLPQETIDEIFEDITSEHPLLSKIGLKNAGLRLKFLKSETSGVAVWGKIFGEIKGQLDAAFSEEEAISNKLTAFVVVPKDLEEFGPAWVERFVRLQIQEAFSVALEIAFLTGDGKDKPIGLDRDVNNGTTASGVTTYPKKTAQGTLTFADSKVTVKELTGVFKYHSVKENGKALAVAGRVVMVVNPMDAWDVKTQYTFLNANGVYVTALPYNLDIVESEAQPQGEVLTFVTGRYDGYLGGGIKVNKFDQTLALEDLELYVAKQFAFGMAKDIKATAIWALNISGTVPSA